MNRDPHVRVGERLNGRMAGREGSGRGQKLILLHLGLLRLCAALQK